MAIMRIAANNVGSVVLTNALPAGMTILSTTAPVSVGPEFRLNLSLPASQATGFYKLIKP